MGPRRWIRSCGLGLCAASGRGLGIRLSARGQCVCSKEAAGPAQAERAQRPAQGRPHRGGVPASTSTGTDGHRKGHRLSHSWGKQDPYEQRYRHTRCKAHSHGHPPHPPGIQTQRHPEREARGWGTDRATHRDIARRAHTWTQTRSDAGQPHPGGDMKAGTRLHTRTTFFSVKER